MHRAFPLLAVIALLAGCAAPPAASVDTPPLLDEQAGSDDVGEMSPLLGAASTTLSMQIISLAHTSSADPPVGPMSFSALGKERRGFAIRQSGDAEHILIAGDRSGAPYLPLVEGHGGLYRAQQNPAWWSKSAYLVSWPGVTGGDSLLIDPYNKVTERRCESGRTLRTLFGILPDAYNCGPAQLYDATSVTAGSAGTMRWSAGYIRAAPFASTSPYLELFLQKDDGTVVIEKLDQDRSREIYRETWSKDWDTFVPYVSGGAFHVLSYSSTTGKAALDRFTPGANGALTLSSVWTDTWRPGWKGFAIMRVGEGLEYVACDPAGEECVLDSIAADGTLTTLARTRVTWTADDLKTLGPMPYSGDGTASLVVRHGDVWTELLFFTDAAAAAKARERRPTANADFDVSGNGLRVTGKLLAAAAAGAPPVGPMSWVPRDDTVTGYASMNAVAQQVVVIPRDGSANGPPDAFKFPTFWGERYGGSRAYATQLITGSGTYDVFIDPYYPAFAYATYSDDPADILKEFLTPEPWELSMDVLVKSIEDPNSNSLPPPELDPRTRITLRAPNGELADMQIGPGFVRAAPLVITHFGMTEQYLLLMKLDGTTEIHRIIVGSPGKVFESRKVYSGQWAEPWDVFRLFSAGGSWYLFSYATQTGKAALDRLDVGDLNALTLTPVWTESWRKNWQGFAPISQQGARGVVFAYAACNFDLAECVIDEFNADLKVSTAKRIGTSGKVPPLQGLAPGFRSDWDKAHLVGWRGGTGWTEMTIAIA